jgi:hypothetical protein
MKIVKLKELNRNFSKIKFVKSSVGWIFDKLLMKMLRSRLLQAAVVVKSLNLELLIVNF